MPQLIYRRAATIPAGTPITAPVTVDVSFTGATVEWVEVRVPPGSNGNLGFYLAMGGQEVLPTNDGTLEWIIAVNETLHWDTADAPDSGAWEVVGYNTGTFPHAVYLTFACTPTDVARPVGNFIPLANLAPDFSAPPNP